MTRKEKRYQSLMPGGVPKWVRIYDNGGGSYDRYTCLFTGRYKGRPRGIVEYRAMSEHPCHPQGFGQWGEGPATMDAPSGFAPVIGRKCHLGTRISFHDITPECQELVRKDYMALWQLNS